MTRRHSRRARSGSAQFLSRLLELNVGSWIGCAVTVLLTLPFCTGLYGSYLITRSYDVPFWFAPSRPASDVVIVYLDEKSHDELELRYYGFEAATRTKHAELLQRLSAAGARTVVFDFVFTAELSTGDVGRSDASLRAATDRLAAALRGHRKAVIASHFRLHEAPALGTGYRLELPEGSLREAAAGVGAAQLENDADIVVRRLPPRLLRSGSLTTPTLMWVAAGVEKPATTNRVSSFGSKWINYYGAPRRLPWLSYSEALRDCPVDVVSNKVVVVGTDYQAGLATASLESFASPYATPERHPGSEVQATILQNLLGREWLVRLPLGLEFLLVVTLGAGLGFGLPRLGPGPAMAAALVAVLGVSAASVILHRTVFCWWPWLLTVGVQVPCAAAWALLFYTLKNHFLEHSLKLYLPPRLVRRLIRHPELLRLGGSKREISILFTDLEGFSKIAERTAPDDLLEFLNRYYEHAIASIHETDGTVVKLIGDSIFAIWNGLQSQPEHAVQAGRAALLLYARAVQLDAQIGTPHLRTRVGLHLGQACVGNLGSSTHFDYTAVGEAVNLASRLEGLNRILDTGVLTSHDFVKATGTQFVSRSVGLFQLKGFHGVVEVDELVGLAPQAESSRVWRELFAHGLHAFQRKDFDAAERSFRETLEFHKDDGPSRFYLDQIKELRGMTLPREWMGEIELKEK